MTRAAGIGCMQYVRSMYVFAYLVYVCRYVGWWHSSRFVVLVFHIAYLGTPHAWTFSFWKSIL